MKSNSRPGTAYAEAALLEGKVAPVEHTAVQVESRAAPRSVSAGSAPRPHSPEPQHGGRSEGSGEHSSRVAPSDTDATSTNTSAFVAIVRNQLISALWPQR